MKQRLASWEPHVRSILRIVLGFLMALHGCRKLFGVLVAIAGRRGAPPLALDALPPVTGVLELVGGLLLIAGLFVRPTALVLSAEALLAYLLIAAPFTAWPIRNGGGEALLYFVAFLYFVVAGAGTCSLDAFRGTHPTRRRSPSSIEQPTL